MNEVGAHSLWPASPLNIFSQVHFGAIWPLSFAAILRAKIGDHHLQRKIALEGHRFTASEAYADGLLDHIVNGNTADILRSEEHTSELQSPA